MDIVPAAGQCGGPISLCMEDRMLHAEATGVATYARSLRMAQQTISSNARLLRGVNSGDPLTRTAWFNGSPFRLLRSLTPRPYRATLSHVGDFFAADIFRLAHIYFTIHGMLLPIWLPGPPGVMHWTYPIPVYAPGWKNLYTIHDLIPITDPALTSIDTRRYSRILERITAVASAIVTVSESTASEIVRHLPYSAQRIFNCSQPVELPEMSALGTTLPETLRPGGYLLVCGSVEPRKNISRLVEAHRRSDTTLPLVLAGPTGWGEETIGFVPDGIRIIRLPYQSRERMIALIANARALLMPSLAEGFGLPVVEAMALGTPVITSAQGALAETAGDAALLVNPADVSAIEAAIRRLVWDDGLCRQLTGAGQRRVTENFTVAMFVDKLRSLYTTIN